MAVWPILNDRPPPQNRQQGVQWLRYRHKLTAPQRARTMVSSVGGVCIFSSFGCRFKPFAAYESFENVGMAQNIVFWNLGLLHRGVWLFMGMLLASLCMLTTIIIFENALHRRDGKILAANMITLYRLGLILLTACLMSLYFVIPFLSNRSFVCDVEHRKWKFDSVGFNMVDICV